MGGESSAQGTREEFKQDKFRRLIITGKGLLLRTNLTTTKRVYYTRKGNPGSWEKKKRKESDILPAIFKESQPKADPRQELSHHASTNQSSDLGESDVRP